jgi:hypothetical protein
MHTTDYTNTFISAAPDCPALQAQQPPMKAGAHTIASLQFELMHSRPYELNSDDVLFSVYASRNDLTSNQLEAARQQFFSKGQPCLRTSPLGRRYGWGIHCDDQGRVALYAVESDTYQRLAADPALKQVQAMQSRKA